ncbi:MAG: DNA repair protein RecO [Planctomycetaceae bacterium]|nr:DNA repair protein RecO [Planctomycetaceae bacterium]
MASEKTQAIVLKVVEFSETSCVLTLFTEHFGKVGALAKGARRPKGPFEGALDLLALVRIVFLRKSSEALDLLTEAKLQRRFRSAQRELSRLYAGYYVAELLSELTDNGDPHPELFALADETLLALDCGRSVAPAVLRFEVLALRLLGHLPSLDECVGCGQSIPDEPRTAFGLVAGGVLCARCRPGQRQVVSITAGGLAALKRFAAVNGDCETLTLDDKVRGELRGVWNNYLAHLIGHKPRMHEYLSVAAK